MAFLRVSIHSPDSPRPCWPRPCPPSAAAQELACRSLAGEGEERGGGTLLSSGRPKPSNPSLRCPGGERGSWSPWQSGSSHLVRQAAAVQEGGHALPELLLFHEKLSIWGFM